MNENSTLLRQTMTITYNYIIIFGIYMIYNGHSSPGGGFQGGAILASVFIVHYLANERQAISSAIFSKTEKILYFSIICLVILVGINRYNFLPREVYLIIMNFLIGVKVCCGLSIVFFRFVLFESR